ncbi:MAG: hypothetical protein D4R64_09630 [Porphyromonadaceae bacterium]|nr:MAG: hypothetical protein D4R64_09630 [Porphyromonadaceae bacterium]
MKKSDQIPSDDLNRLHDTIESLQSRVEQLEAKMVALESSPIMRYIVKDEEDETGDADSEETRKGIESAIGEHGFAWISSIILIFFVVFLMVLFQKNWGSLAATMSGLAASAVVFLLTLLLRKRFSGQVNRIHTGILMLLYYISLRLHFFTDDPLIASLPLSLIILAIPVVIQFVYALKRKSQFLTGIGLIMLIAAGLCSDVTEIILFSGAVTTGLSIMLLWRNNWSQQVYFALFLVYLNHVLWLFGNPAGGNDFVIREVAGYNLLFLFGYGILFSLGSILLLKKEQPVSFSISTTMWNALFFSTILALEVTTFYKKNYMLIFAVITVFSLGYSALLQLKGKHRFITAFYACVSFIALSITIYGYAGLPQSYLWLALQSLLVVSIALWFRSQIIVWVNTLLFVGILLFYLAKSPSLDTVNFVFAIVALLTARFLNWKKERLTLRTEALRNIYLLAAFFMLLLALFKAIPKQFITLSWVGAAAFYFILSILLRNIKYRYMAIGTLIVAILYLFLIDLKNMEVGFRVVAFLIVAMISLAGSLYYTNLKVKKKPEKDRDL